MFILDKILKEQSLIYLTFELKGGLIIIYTNPNFYILNKKFIFFQIRK